MTQSTTSKRDDDQVALKETTSLDNPSEEHSERRVPKHKHVHRDLMDVSSLLDRAPSQRDYERHGKYSCELVMNFYKDWSEVARAVGRGVEDNE